MDNFSKTNTEKKLKNLNKKNRPFHKRIFSFLIKLILIIIFLLSIIAFIFTIKFAPKYYEYKDNAVNVVSDSNYSTFSSNLSSYIYDDEGNLISKLSLDRFSDYIYYEDIPENVINAYIAVEDRTFWEHNGYDIDSIIRVCINYLKTKGEEKHGASTITQQLARGTFLSNEVTIERKLKEIFIAIELEKKYTKEEILEFYINNTYYANNFYGIKTAAKGYFNKDVSELTLSETAYLCAIPNRPSYYNPNLDKERAVVRRDKILKDMYECGYITEAELEDALSEDIVLVQIEDKEMQDYETTYATDCAIRYLMHLDDYNFRYSFISMEDYKEYLKEYNLSYEEYRQKLYKGGYKIYTSLNKNKQELLQNSINETMSFSKDVDDNGVYKLQSAATVIDNTNHKVVAIVGGREQDSNTYTLNRAYQGYRQPGSAIKPLIVYAPALECGYNGESIVQNIDVDKTKEENVDVNTLTGPEMTLRSAVEHSINGVAWSVFCKISPAKGLSYLQEMEFSKIVPNDFYPASSLGGFTYGVTTVEMANGYSTLVNNGVYNEATCLVSMLDKEGNEIYSEADSKQVYTPNSSYEMLDILKGVLTRGTAARIGWSGKVEAAGKTGTTNKSKDGWFCGVSPDYSISVWVGYDQPKELSNLYGSTYPAKIWKSVMKELVKNSTNTKFQKTKAESIAYDGLNSNGAMAYDQYLPGRLDEEILSNGYTVKNYREDHILADNAEAILYKLENMPINTSNFKQKGEEYYFEAYNLIDQIYGRTLYNKEMKKLEKTLNVFKKKLSQIQSQQ